MSQYISYSSRQGSGGGATLYANFAAFPASASNGALGLALDTDILYAFNTGSMTWVPVGGTGAVLGIGTIDSTTASANGAAVSANLLIMQSASATRPGLVNITTQTFAGAKTFTGAISASNLSGTNTGDVTIGTASGLSIVGQVLSLGLSSTSTTGALSSTDWNTFNGKQAAGNYITALTGDVTATGPGSVAATVVSVGGSSAANVNSATVLALAATSTNTANAIVRRGASGQFSAGAITMNRGSQIVGSVNEQQFSLYANTTQTAALFTFYDSSGNPILGMGNTGGLISPLGITLGADDATLKFLGSVSGTLTVAVPATITDYTMTLPAAQGTGALTNDGSGILSWASGGSPHVQYITLSAGDIIAGNSGLSFTPAVPANTIVDIISIGPQIYGVDFTVIGATVDWNGLGMSGLVVTGDILRVLYFT